MAAQRSDPALARAAWGELYGRHHRYLFVVVSRGYGKRLGDDEVSDVVVDTFHAAFEWGGKQPFPECAAARFHDADRDGIRCKVLAWLSVISRRIAMRRIRCRGETHALLHDVAAEDVSEAAPSTRLGSLLASAIEQLTEDEVEALRVSLPWYQPETGEFAFPRGEAARIASSLGISSESLRQRRHRSLKRLASILGSRSKP